MQCLYRLEVMGGREGGVTSEREQERKEQTHYTKIEIDIYIYLLLLLHNASSKFPPFTRNRLWCNMLIRASIPFISKPSLYVLWHGHSSTTLESDTISYPKMYAAWLSMCYM